MSEYTYHRSRRTYGGRETQQPMEVRDAILVVAGLLLAIMLFGIAGSMDYEDRTAGLGASMMPDPGWWEQC